MFILIFKFRPYKWKDGLVVTSDNVDALKKIRAMIEQHAKDRVCKLLEVPPDWGWRMFLQDWLEKWGESVV